VVSELILGPQAASGTILRIKGGFLYIASSSLKRVTETIVRISKCFHKSLKPSEIIFSTTRQAKNLKNNHTDKKY
jgi:hypothetical protein